MTREEAIMEDYQKYINALRKCAKEHENDITPTFKIIVSDLCRDTANLLKEVEQKKKLGKWILLDECANSGYYCSECQKKLVKEGWSNTVKKINFCPNCGAKMESEDKE